MRALITSSVVVALALVIVSCGGGSGNAGTSRADLRECLVARGARVESDAAASSSLVPGTVASPDFQAEIGSDTMDAIVEGSSDRAGRTAADLRSALRSYGVPDPERRLIQHGNVIVVFARDPSAAAGDAVQACTG